MKKVVILNDLKEADIRPENIYNEYKQLLSKDIQRYFYDQSKLIKINCPGCGDKNSEFLFNKMDFDYQVCRNCSSLFVSPRPTDDAIRYFYKNSKAGIFLRTTFLGDTLEARSKQVFSYRIQWIIGLIEEYLGTAGVFLDFSSRYPTFLNELKNTGLFNSILSLLPECYEQSSVMDHSIKVVNNNDMTDGSVDIFAAFEALEKVFSPQELINYAYKICKKNALCLITTTTSSGFEYQVLGKYSPNIFPTDRINLLSLEALTRLIEMAGFEIIEMSTPGRLDVEMVKKTYENNSDMPLDPFWKYLFHNRDENALHAFQEYLQQFQLSSHIRIAAIKK